MDLTELAKKLAADDKKADTLNANIGTDGTNITYDKARGNRGKQLNPTWHPNYRAPGAPDDEEAEGEIYGPVGDN